jgi:hypothetical protein
MTTTPGIEPRLRKEPRGRRYPIIYAENDAILERLLKIIHPLAHIRWHYLREP